MVEVRRRIPWYRRLGLWLAVSLTVVLIGFHEAGERLTLWSAQQFDRPLEGEVFILENDWIDDVLLTDAEPYEGGLRPDLDSIFSVEASYAQQGLHFFWLGTDNFVFAASEIFADMVDEPWPHSLESFQDIDFGEHGVKRTTIVPHLIDGVVVGTLVSVLWNPAQHAFVEGVGPDELHLVENCEFAPEAAQRFLTMPEFEAKIEQAERLSRVVGYGTVLLFALVLGVVVSWLVTGRIRHLADQAAVPLDSEGGIPGPFTTRGWDEISELGKTMNSMRARVAELLVGLATQDARRREWIAQVSHDLRTPLTALTACLDRADMVLSSTDSRELVKEMREVLGAARIDADRVNALADDLLEIARLDAGDNLDREPVPPAELVRQAIRGLGPMAQALGVEVSAQVSSPLPILYADGRRLMRAVENLLRNAIHHARRFVEVWISPEGDGLRVEVRDDGQGLPEEEGRVVLENLAGRRSRADSAGLGLVVTRRVAEAHGGQVGAYNLSTGGAAVWFRIPCAEIEI